MCVDLQALVPVITHAGITASSPALLLLPSQTSNTYFIVAF
jgi:hypothetical protein